MGSMLRTLRHGFLKEALDFAGVHRERLAEVCKHSIVLMMAILGDRGAASRHEIFTNEMTASIVHIKNESEKIYSSETVPEAFRFHCFRLIRKYFLANQGLSTEFRSFWNMWFLEALPFYWNIFQRLRLQLSISYLMDSKNDNQCKKNVFSFFQQ